MFSRLFFDSNFYPNTFSKTRIGLAICYGLFSAIVLYSFFYVLDDVFRLIELGFIEFPQEISESEKYKHNLFYAAISVMIGNSVFISYLFSRPSKALNRRSFKQKRILNDQVFLGANFVHWFLRIGVVFGVFAANGFNFKNEFFYYPIQILIIIVLYLDIWKTLLQILKKSKYKILFIHFITTVILILSLAKFDVTDYKRLEKVALKYNPIIDLPYSNYSSPNYYQRFNVVNLRLKLNSNKELDIYVENRRLSEKEKIKLNELQEIISKIKSSVREEVVLRMTVNLFADADLKLLYIKQLEAQLLKNNISRINYIAVDSKEHFNEWESKSIFKAISYDVLDIENKRTGIKLPLSPDYSQIRNYYKNHFKDSLLIQLKKEIEVDGELITKNNLSTILKNKINAKTYIKYIYDDNTTYQDYIDMLSIHYETVEKLREKEQKNFKVYPQSNNAVGFGSEAYKREHNRLIKMYPIHIRESFL